MRKLTLTTLAAVLLASTTASAEDIRPLVTTKSTQATPAAVKLLGAGAGLSIGGLLVGSAPGLMANVSMAAATMLRGGAVKTTTTTTTTTK